MNKSLTVGIYDLLSRSWPVYNLLIRITKVVIALKTIQKVKALVPNEVGNFLRETWSISLFNEIIKTRRIPIDGRNNKGDAQKWSSYCRIKLVSLM